MNPLPAEAVKAGLAALPEWRRRGGVLHRAFEFQDFAAAMRFVNGVARAAEKANHHPDIDIRWNRVRLALTTHDAGGLTEADFKLAAAADRLGARQLLTKK